MTRTRPRITAASWWRAAGNAFETIVREYLALAVCAEHDETGHECGHQFEVTVRSALHMSGPGDHTDADYFDASVPVTVRAHNLRDALLLAATLPLSAWFGEDPEGES